MSAVMLTVCVQQGQAAVAQSTRAVTSPVTAGPAPTQQKWVTEQRLSVRLGRAAENPLLGKAGHRTPGPKPIERS